ncbi:iron ABC transporter permease [Alkalicoccus urumqiensis]|uniref:Fe3+-hydroxamate ABC transporter permease FhuB n=1 Tax=Alkalicoccus urumqiensis TaxID=1548213 RepID=A0A2P6MII6_ALKUR|nr:iron ABC transporter permease [Alkalicoccus urumqiensis]PRO66077.1 Fe3+-hydroxamate ABC transporter permease FhuB [Alkalicoccus urumqiensis]
MQKQAKGRAALILAVGAALLSVLGAVHVLQGNNAVPFSVVLDVLGGSGDTVNHEIVRGVRLPRLVVGILAGAAFGAAGVLFQTLTKNPLASPATLGVNAGAYFVVVAGSVFLPFAVNGFVLALAGGLFAAVITFALAGGISVSPVRMALSGMILTLAFSAFTSVIQIFYEYETAGLFLWGNGTLLQQNWNGTLFMLPWIVVSAVVLALFAPKFDVLLLGEETARALGENLVFLKVLVFLGATLLTAAAVSVVGPIGFIGLIAPHLLRILGLYMHRWLLLGSMIWGAAILIGADVLARIIDQSARELPVGAVTAFIGAPWLIWLIWKYRGTFFAGASRRSSQTMANRPWPFAVVLPLAAAALLASFFFSTAVSSQGFAIVETWRAFTDPEAESLRFLVFDLRLSRVLVAAVAGAMLAAAGLFLQSVLRNPLADPSVIGISSGAGVGAMLILFAFPAVSAVWIPVGAVLGGCAAVAVVLFLAWRMQFQPAVLALLGIAVSALGTAVIQLFVVRYNLNAATALTWLSGSTYARGWSELYTYLLPPLILFVPLAVFYLKKLDLLAFGDETATSLGLAPQQTRWTVTILGTLLAAFAVSAVGTIGFVGLVAPHLARLLAGTDHRRLLPLAMVLGATLLMAADGLGRLVLAPKEIPSGIVVALIGAPFFLWLMRKQK